MTHQKRSANQTPPTKAAGHALTQTAKAYVEAHSEEKFALQAVADALFVNSSYLLRVFKANTGHTLLWYHNHVRCERAKALLRLRDRSISQVGEQVGFVSPAHFSHVFKKMTGMTPSDYRLTSASSDRS